MKTTTSQTYLTLELYFCVTAEYSVKLLAHERTWGNTAEENLYTSSKMNPQVSSKSIICHSVLGLTLFSQCPFIRQIFLMGQQFQC